jgi:CelD/BcsL family acetyltransferase involved in cellulose biosynthesis
MTMAAVMESRTAEAPARSRTSHIASLDILTDVAGAEPTWRVLEAQQQLSTPYQRFDLLSIWQREVGSRDASPFIVIAYDAERRPLLLLPLALRNSRGVRIASFMGGKYTSFNMALWDRHFAAEAGAEDLAALLSLLRERAAADVLALTQQPKRWRDVPNPFAMLPHQASVNGCPVLIMPKGAAPSVLISNSQRRRLKAKERKLETLPGYRCRLAGTDAEIARLLDWFFRTKPVRMAEQKLPNVFADPGVEDFVRGACMAKLAGGGRAIDIHALECDEEVIALFAGVADGDRFSMMFNTYTMSASSRYSPGLILMRNIIDEQAARGCRALDLGVGSDEYKRLFCKSDEPIFDCFIPLSPRGKLAASAMSGLNRCKHLVKHNQVLLFMAQKLRSALHR